MSFSVLNFCIRYAFCRNGRRDVFKLLALFLNISYSEYIFLRSIIPITTLIWTHKIDRPIMGVHIAAEFLKSYAEHLVFVKAYRLVANYRESNGL